MKAFFGLDTETTLKEALKAALEREWARDDPVLEGMLRFLARRLEEARAATERLPQKTLIHLYSLLGVKAPDPKAARAVVVFDVSEKTKEPLVLEKGLSLAAGELTFETEEEIWALPGGWSRLFFYVPSEILLLRLEEILPEKPATPGALPSSGRFTFRARFPLEVLAPEEKFDLAFVAPAGGIALFAEGKNGKRPLHRQENLFSLPRDLLPLEDEKGKYFIISGESHRPISSAQILLKPGPKRITHLFAGDRPLARHTPVFFFKRTSLDLRTDFFEVLPRIYPVFEKDQEHFAVKNPFGTPPVPGVSFFIGGFWLLPGTRCQIESPFPASALSWEYFDGKSWKPLKLENREAILPDDLAPTVVNQVFARWLRIRYVGPFQPSPEKAPSDYYLNVSVFMADQSFVPEEIKVSNLGEESESLPQKVPDHGLSPKEAALYLCLKKPYSGGPVTLYFRGKAPRETLKRLEVSTASGFEALAFEDTTHRLKGPGFLRFYLPESFSFRKLFGEEGAWLRLVLTKEEAQKIQIEGLYLNAVTVREGQSLRLRAKATGKPGEEFSLKPLVGKARVSVGGKVWQIVDDLSLYGPEEEVAELDPQTGRLVFGDGVHGKVPERDALIEVHYVSHHGDRGNVPAWSIKELVSPLPFMEGVRQPEAAVGGKTEVQEKLLLRRLPQIMRHRQRATTSSDLENLLGELEEIKRLHFAFAGERLILYVLPQAEDLAPRVSQGLREKIQEKLSPALPLTLSAFEVQDPLYVPIHLKADLVISHGVALKKALTLAQEALRRFLHPVKGNFQGEGFPFGRLPYLSDFYRLLQGLPVVRAVRKMEIYARVGEDFRPYREGRPPQLPLYVLPTPGEISLKGVSL